MSEPSSRPDVASVLQALRAQAAQMDVVHMRDVDLVKQISDRAAELLNIERIQPTVLPVIDALKARAGLVPNRVRFTDVGTVQRIGDDVAKLSGLPNARTEELVTFPTGVQGMILNLEETSIDVILLGSDEGIQGGDLVTSSGERLRVPVGRRLLGRVVNPLGVPLDGRGSIETAEMAYLEREAPGIVERDPVNEPMYTGLKVVDSMLSIGRGQRELILGDRQTGKTTMAVDAIMNQRDTDVLCVYVSIGQKKSSSLSVIETLREHHAMSYTTVVVSGPDDPPALRYLAPYAACSMAEHADAYRELSLLLRRPPGREAYPGDIFYLHARLLERACKLSAKQGGGSLTALPIAQTQRGNISAYIPTNLISITDGQIILDTELFNRNVRPAVNIGQSVSRVGGAAQTPAMRQVAGELKLDLSQYRDVARFARFGTEVEEATQRQIQRGLRLEASLRQPEHQPLSLAEQLVILVAATGGYLDDVAPSDVPAFERQVRERFRSEYPGVYNEINRTGEFSEEARETLVGVLTEFRSDWARRSEPR
jgi:F-type H+-transporting ATPase subunit alpha